jgi:hypothetical protein
MLDECQWLADCVPRVFLLDSADEKMKNDYLLIHIARRVRDRG